MGSTAVVTYTTLSDLKSLLGRICASYRAGSWIESRSIAQKENGLRNHLPKIKYMFLAMHSASLTAPVYILADTCKRLPSDEPARGHLR